MALEFVMQFPQQAFTVGQELVFSFTDKKYLSVIVKDLEGAFLSEKFSR
jgi:vesicle-fusing ATPase